MSLRVGVAGVAGMGLYHLITIPRIEGYELTAICDPWPKALENAQGLAPDAQTFADFGDLCTSGAVDAVVLATPNATHSGQVTTALEAGLHVYCEKPLGITVGECRQASEVADSTGLKLTVGFQHRFQPNYSAARAFLQDSTSGALTRAELISTDWFRPNSYFAKRPWRGQWEGAGGGVLMNQAIHHLDAFCWLSGMPSRVLAKAWSTRDDIQVEDAVHAILELSGGGRGSLQASTTSPYGRTRIELETEAATLVAEGGELRIGRLPQPLGDLMDKMSYQTENVEVAWETAVATGPETSSDDTFDQCVVACHRDFLEAITEGRQPLNNGPEATRSVELANAIYLSAATGEEVDLPLDTEAYSEVFEGLTAGRLELP